MTKMVRDALEWSGLDPRRLELEVTEISDGTVQIEAMAREVAALYEVNHG